MPPWSFGQMKQRHPLMVCSWCPHGTWCLQGGAWGEFSISNVVDEAIPDLMLGSLQNANSF